MSATDPRAPRLAPPFRRAVAGDAPALARLIDLAGEGLPAALWQRTAAPGQSALEVGMARAAREEGGFSYRNAVVAEIDGGVAGMLLGYRQPDPYDPGDLAQLPEPVRPLLMLEARAPGSWYVNGLAVFPEYRGRGLASGLLGVAAALARQAGAPVLSVIVGEWNGAARRLYEREGYREAGRLAAVALPGVGRAGEWILLTRPAAERAALTG
ncbi:MAG TPA: GNAT family N-acetyltransferase [Pelomicrobium sp.]|nr:GNAT family N-acetyltransferase [Pelomicrobium sp.]